MANDLTADPLIIDTAHATNVVVQGNRIIYGIKLSGATAGDAAILTVKSSGKVFWRHVGAGVAGDAPLDVLRILTPGDLVAATLPSGTILVYLGQER